MNHLNEDRRCVGPAIAIAVSLAVLVAGCGKKEEAAPAATAANPPAAAAPAGQAPVVAPTATAQTITQTWTPEAMEELLAPIALYPDPVLSQVLIASTNPQEVLDAGNWLLSNQNLTGKALDDAAVKVGFTPPVRSLVHFPETVDMLCMQLDWTTELGQAFVADQQGVLDAIQRLRKQAKDVGNLQSSDQLKVETQVQDGQEVVVLSPPKPEVVYVPQYDPQAVYAPAPVAPAAAPVAAPATTTTTTTTESTGHSTGALVTTGLLAFGAGMLVNEVFNDDDDWDNYPNYGHGGMPYYPPYPYRPPYGGGYYPSNGYNRPPNYQHGFNNNNTVIINNGGNDYWNNRSKSKTGYQKQGANRANSPITAAKANRPELNELNKRQPKPMPADARRPSPTATRDNYRSQSGYAGAKKGQASTPRPTTSGAGAYGKGSREAPKVQGSYAGATPDRAKSNTRPSTGPSTMPSSRDAQRPQSSAKSDQGNKPQGDRGYGAPQAQRPQPQNKPAPAAKPQQMNRPAPSTGGGGGNNRGTAVSGANKGGNADRAASQRGKQSMPQGAKSKGHGGGGKNKGR